MVVAMAYCGTANDKIFQLEKLRWREELDCHKDALYRRGTGHGDSTPGFRHSTEEVARVMRVQCLYSMHVPPSKAIYLS